MSNPRVINRFFLLVLLCVLNVVSTNDKALHGQTVATWNGNGDGISYNDPGNWDLGIVPINSVMSGNFNIIVPNGVNLDFNESGEVSGVGFGTSGSLDIQNGINFSVDSVAVINSDIAADGTDTSFTAIGVGVALASNVRVSAIAGAEVQLSPINYNWSEAAGTTPAFIANGIGSELRFPELNFISNTGPNFFATSRPEFAAINGGILDLSNVISMSGGAGPDNSGFAENVFRVDPNSTLLFDSLEVLERYNLFEIQTANYTFPNLATAGGVNFDVADGTDLSLPSLFSVAGWVSNFQVGAGGSIDAPVLTTLNDTVVTLGDAAFLNIPTIQTFRNSQIQFDSSSTINVGPLLDLDNSRISVLDGLSLEVSEAAYNFNRNATNNVFSAIGPGSTITAPNLVEISNSGPNFFASSRAIFRTLDSGRLDFSTLQMITGGAGPDNSGFAENVFELATNGEIDFDNLQIMTRYNRFEIDVSNLVFPSLTNAGGVTFNLNVGRSVNTPLLDRVEGWLSNMSVPIFATWDAPMITALNDTNVVMEPGGMINAPNLSEFVNSSISLEPGELFATGLLTQVDNSRIEVMGGVNITIGAESYNFDRNASNFSFRAVGPGARIESTTLVEVSNTGPNFFASSISTFLAEDGGEIDFGNLDSIGGGAGPNNNGFARNVFDAQSGGKVFLGNVVASQFNNFEADGFGSKLSLKGLDLGPNSTVVVQNLAALEVAGPLINRITGESNFDVDEGIVAFVGIETSVLEVCGANEGLATEGLQNFGFQQLRIGTDSNPTTVVLSDIIDNGNRVDGNSEVQYLLDINGQGLVLINGSKLILNGLDLFISNGTNSFFSVRELFVGDEQEISFSSGTICRTADVGDIINGDFETGDLTGFNVSGDGTASVVNSPINESNSVLKLAGAPSVEVSQFVSLPNEAFSIFLDALALSQTGTLEVIIDQQIVASFDAAELGNGVFENEEIMISMPAFFGLVDVPLTVRWTGGAGDCVLIDNLSFNDPVLLGDVNGDGVVSLLDVQPFVVLLTNGQFQAEADVNQDGVVDLLDVAPFVEILNGG